MTGKGRTPRRIGAGLAALVAAFSTGTGPCGAASGDPVVERGTVSSWIAPGSIGSGAGSSDDAVRAPTPGSPAVVRRFRAPAHAWSAGHRGTDLALDAGAAVLAPADGVVVFAGVVVDRGVVTIRHHDGLRTSLEPVTALVTAGEQVERGRPVGTLEAAPSHCAPATCLHWGVRDGMIYIDPLTLLRGGGPVVLLPRGSG